MISSKFKVFTKPQTLHAAGRTLVEQFIASFADALRACGLSLPEAGITDEEYFCRVSALLLNPDGLPQQMNEALFAVDEMATREGRERLDRALEGKGISLGATGDLTDAEVAVRVWLLAPGIIAEEHNLRRMRRLSKFHCFGNPACATGSATVPGQEQLQSLEEALDNWFARHQRGRRTVRVMCYPHDDELWFLIRHGDTYTRRAAVEERRTQLLHFRPERDDVTVYCLATDEILVCTRTQGERGLYRREFGRLLRSSPEYFSESRKYTLEPLRRDGPLALETQDVEGLRKVTLTEVKILDENGTGSYRVYGSEDLFATSSCMEEPRIPSTGRLVRASFEVHFTGVPRPRTVHVEEPNILRLGRHCDARVIGRFLSSRGFKRTTCR